MNANPVHRLTIGDFELTAISDGTYHLDGGAFFGVVPKVMWERRVKADEKNLVPSGLNSVVVRTGEKTVLIETGIGNKLPDRMVKIYGQPSELLNNLSAAGISPGDIDIVINTHLHFDHCGWNTVRQGDKIVATFPNAQYYVQEGEWQHARRQHERDAISYISDNYDPLIANGQMHLLKELQAPADRLVGVAERLGHGSAETGSIRRWRRPAMRSCSSVVPRKSPFTHSTRLSRMAVSRPPHTGQGVLRGRFQAVKSHCG